MTDYNNDILESDIGMYTNLHAHCRIASPLDGFSDIEDYVIRAKAMGMRGVCFSDHGLMSAAYELEKICSKHGMKPIYANELYFTPNDPLRKEKIEGFKPSYHLLLIAYNQEGYGNLMKLSSDAWTKYRYYKPRVSWDQLQEHSEGIICLQACFTPENLALTSEGFSYIEDVKSSVFNGDGEVSCATRTLRDYNGAVKSIKFKYGMYAVCTENHKFSYIKKSHLSYAKSKRGIGNKYVPVVNFDDKFTAGDIALIPVRSLSHYVSSNITTSLAFILGAYAAEGYSVVVGSERCDSELSWTHFVIHEDEISFKEQIIRHAIAVDNNSIISIKEKSRSKAITVSIKSRYISDSCREYVGHYSHLKNLNKKLLFATADVKKYFLSGYCYGDGYFRVTKSRLNFDIKSSAEFTSVSVSKLMTCSLSYMFTSLGIKTSISEVPASIDKNGVSHKIAYYLRSYGDSAYLIKQLMDYVDGKNIPVKFKNQFNILNLNGIFYYENKITSINYSEYTGQVYCLNVPNGNTFITGLVKTSNCIGGYPAQMLLEGKTEESEDAIRRFVAIYGNKYFLEMQYTGISEQDTVNRFFREMSKKHNIPLVITCDSHYTWKHESELHRALVTINTGGIYKKRVEKKEGEFTDGSKDTDESSMFYTPGEYYLKPYHVLKEYFNEPGDDVAFTNTNKIADMCNVVLPKGLKIFPQIIDDPDKYIMDECIAFLNKYCESMDEAKRKVYFDRLDEEYWTISRMGYCDYFVVVQDIIKYCIANNILVGPGRGSAAGCLVSYCLGITWIDPIEYGLLFSRFLSSSRAKLPLIEFDGYPISENNYVV